jgi:hypothetical protein
VTSASGSASKLKPDRFPLPALATAGGGSGSRRVLMGPPGQKDRRQPSAALWAPADLPAQQTPAVQLDQQH